MLNLYLPYFGKRGTIKTITETKHTYIITRHNLPEQQIVPKKHKNLIGLYENYYQDMKEYLKHSSNEYINAKNIIEKRRKENKLKNNINVTRIKKIMNISIGTTLLSIPLIICPIPILTYTGVIITSLSISCLYATIDLINNYKKDTKKINFIKNYNNYQQELNNYQTTIKTNQERIPTKYNGLNSDKTLGNNLELTKKKVLINNTYSNAA